MQNILVMINGGQYDNERADNVLRLAGTFAAWSVHPDEVMIFSGFFGGFQAQVSL